ncbi:hypothetical protein R6Q59_028872 [Mikania micrantha]
MQMKQIDISKTFRNSKDFTKIVTLMVLNGKVTKLHWMLVTLVPRCLRYEGTINVNFVSTFLTMIYKSIAMKITNITTEHPEKLIGAFRMENQAGMFWVTMVAFQFDSAISNLLHDVGGGQVYEHDN